MCSSRMMFKQNLGPRNRPLRRPLFNLMSALLLLNGCSGGESNQSGPDGDMAEDFANLPEYLCGGGELCGLARYADGVADQDVLFVNPCCAYQGTADGTLARPHPSLAEAVAASGPGRYALAAGTYEESVAVQGDLSLLGPGRDRIRLQGEPGMAALAVSDAQAVQILAMTVEAGQGGVGLSVSGSASLALSDTEFAGGHTGVALTGVDSTEIGDVLISEATAFGLVAKGGTVQLRGVAISGVGDSTSPDQCEQKPAAAIAGDGGVTITVRARTEVALNEEPSEQTAGLVITDSDGWGVLLFDSSFDIEHAIIRGNFCGGLAVSASASSGSQSSVKSTLVLDNNAFGIASWGSGLTVEDTTVGNVPQSGVATGDCIFITESGEAQVRITNNHLSGCGRVGVLLNAVETGSLVGNMVSTTELGGLFVQSASLVAEVAQNEILDLKGVGLSVVASTVELLDGNNISGLSEAPYYVFDSNAFVDMADGIYLRDLDGAGTTLLTNNKIVNNNRSGLLVDGCEQGSIAVGDGNIVAGNDAAGVVLQNGSEWLEQAGNLQQKLTFAADGAGENGSMGNIVTNQVLPTWDPFPVSSTQPGASLCLPPECTE